jgi:hypothetical protein
MNGLNLHEDFMNKKKNNVIDSEKVFAQDVSVINNVIVADHKKIQGVDLSEMARNAVWKVGGTYEIHGNKSFSSLEVNHLQVGSINGVTFSYDNLLLTFGNQTIRGNKVFRNHVSFGSEVNSRRINGIEIPGLASRLVLKGLNNTITAPITFTSTVNANNVNAYGKVDQIDVRELNYLVHLPVDLKDMNMKVNQVQAKIDRIQTVLDENKKANDY